MRLMHLKVNTCGERSANADIDMTDLLVSLCVTVYLQRCECFQSSECVGGHFSDFVVAQISAIEIKRTSSKEQLYYSVLFHCMKRHK